MLDMVTSILDARQYYRYLFSTIRSSRPILTTGAERLQVTDFDTIRADIVPGVQVSLGGLHAPTLVPS